MSQADSPCPTPLAVRAVPILHPLAVFTVETATSFLNVQETTLLREIRLGRLEARRRAGRYWIIGSSLMKWLKSGETPRRHGRKKSGGAARAKSGSSE